MKSTKAKARKKSAKVKSPKKRGAREIAHASMVDGLPVNGEFLYQGESREADIDSLAESMQAEEGAPFSDIENWRIDSLIPRAHNPRTHDAEQIQRIANSIEAFGFTTPLLIEPGGHVIAGHGRLLAARLRQFDRVPCIVARNWTAEQVRAYVIADNKLALDAGWDEELLRAEFDALESMDFDLSLTGFSEDEVDALYRDESIAETAETETVPVPIVPITKPGDTWLLGRHRVHCGDARQKSALKKLLKGEVIDCVFIDPPYNVDYEGEAGQIRNDAKPEKRYAMLLLRVFSALFEAMHPGAPIYVAHADIEGETVRKTFGDAGFHFSACLIWRKNQMVLGRSDYNWRHEPILYGWKTGAAHRWYGERDKTTVQEFDGSEVALQADGSLVIGAGDDAIVIRGDNLTIERQQGDVLSEDKPARSPEHPTMKPLALVKRLLANSTQLNDLIVDVVCGSGQTLLAAHELGRRAFVMDIDPKFVDVTVARWQTASGEVAIREADGVMFSTLSG